MTLSRSCIVMVAALALAVLRPATSFGHDIPNHVIVHMFLKPEGTHLRLLVRAPLEAMRDVDVPLRRGEYIDLQRANPWFRDAANMWIAENIELFEEDARLQDPRIVALRPSLPSDKSFQTYETALAHVAGPPLPVETDLYWNQGVLDVLFEYPIRSDRARFSIHPAFERLALRVSTVLHYLPPQAPQRVLELHGTPGLVRLDPRWHQAFLGFVEMGFFHILDGMDHLLFLLCLVVATRRILPLVAVVTSFTVAHSITLIASASGMAPSALWFPPLVETLIAVSIVYMALENILRAHPTRRYAITFAFGLIHGFGFSFVLAERLQLAGSHLLTSLLSFNLGVELGQVLMLIVFAVALEGLFRLGVAERAGQVVISALVAHTGWHWMVERGGQLAQFPRPAFDLALLATAMRWILVLVIVVGVIWIARLFRRSASADEQDRAISPAAQADDSRL